VTKRGKASSSRRKTVLTAVVVSVLIACFLDFITPDVWALMFFKGVASPSQLFQFGVVGLIVGVLVALLIR